MIRATGDVRRLGWNWPVRAPGHRPDHRVLPYRARPRVEETGSVSWKKHGPCLVHAARLSAFPKRYQRRV